MKYYKLTDENCLTQNMTLWGKGVKHSIHKKDRKKKLCSSGVLHAYSNINLALLLNPIHANILDPILWECKGRPMIKDWGKVGFYTLTTTNKIELPNWYNDVKIRKKINIQFSVLCAENVLSIFENQYPNDDRPRKAIEAARKYLNTDADADAARAAADAARAAADAAADFADFAYAAADAAADAAYAAAAAADAAAYAADAAADAAADFAAYAAYAAYAAAVCIDFGKLADKAVEMIINN